jgi:hypothetical protein
MHNGCARKFYKVEKKALPEFLCALQTKRQENFFRESRDGQKVRGSQRNGGGNVPGFSLWGATACDAA